MRPHLSQAHVAGVERQPNPGRHCRIDRAPRISLRSIRAAIPCLSPQAGRGKGTGI